MLSFYCHQLHVSTTCCTGLHVVKYKDTACMYVTRLKTFETSDNVNQDKIHFLPVYTKARMQGWDWEGGRREWGGLKGW